MPSRPNFKTLKMAYKDPDSYMSGRPPYANIYIPGTHEPTEHYLYNSHEKTPCSNHVLYKDYVMPSGATGTTKPNLHM
jgi:hypothetical protein